MPSTRKLMTAATCAGVAVTGIATLASADAASTAKVHVKDIDFSPHALKVKKGTKVSWLFEDELTPHNVTSRGKNRFKSSKTVQEGSYSVTFRKAGTFSYVCTVHPNMKAKVVVR